jgi:hypothetical protein
MEFLQQRASALADYFEDAFSVGVCYEYYSGCLEFHVVKGDINAPLFASLEKQYPTSEPEPARTRSSLTGGGVSSSDLPDIVEENTSVPASRGSSIGSTGSGADCAASLSSADILHVRTYSVQASLTAPPCCVQSPLPALLCRVQTCQPTLAR